MLKRGDVLNKSPYEEPFNDAMKHQQNIEGSPVPNGRGKLPLPIKIIGFFLLTGIVLIIIFGIIGSLFMN